MFKFYVNLEVHAAIIKCVLLATLISSVVDTAVYISVMLVAKEMIFGYIQAVVHSACILFSQLITVRYLATLFAPIKHGAIELDSMYVTKVMTISFIDETCIVPTIICYYLKIITIMNLTFLSVL